jgi:Zn finger protein HypA/HybF involved in hydrogenase expression
MNCNNCNVEIDRGSYCSNKCQQNYQNSTKIEKWLNGLNETRKGGTSIPSWMRTFLLEEANHQCSKCGWSEINEFTQTVPLEIDHVDGDAYNNLRENLRVLCPNCHSLTKTFRNAGNRISTRSYRRL